MPAKKQETSANVPAKHDNWPYPNLAGVAHADDISQVQAGKFTADYINWSRTMQMLRDHAPGWLPELVPNDGGLLVHEASGIGGVLMIRFVHDDGRKTPAVPQAVMDNYNKAIPLDKIDARDITDTHRRGICLAAALHFGLAYELWAKLELESGYGEREQAPEPEKAQRTVDQPRTRPEPTNAPPQRANGARLTIPQHVKAIMDAADMAELRKAFALGWKQYENPDNPKDITTLQTKLQVAYNARRDELTAPEPATEEEAEEAIAGEFGTTDAGEFDEALKP